MKHSLYLTWIRCRLALSLAITWFQLIWVKIPFGVKFISCFTVIALVGTFIVTKSLSAQAETLLVETTPPPHSDLYSKKLLTKQQLETEKQLLENLLQQQPGHRDILINLALVHQALGNEVEYQKYWKQAERIDPNNEVFN